MGASSNSGLIKVAGRSDRPDVISYTIDHTDTIVAVNGNWDAFALDNNGQEVVSEKIIGKKLDRFIVGDATRMFVRTMIMSARTLNRSVYRPYRCDSPQAKRFMEMIVVPGEAGAVEIQHRELHSEPIAHPIPIFSALAQSEGAYVKRCSVCNRIQTQGLWSEIDSAVESGRVEARVRSLKVIYGVCPDCLARPGVPL